LHPEGPYAHLTPESVVKLALNVFFSLVVLGLCLWLVWPNATARAQLDAAVSALEFRTFAPYLFGYVGLLAATHFFRAWRWNNLLRPINVSLPPGKLLAISSVGFMAILALPARLGEFVRPALLRKKGKVSASAVLGTVAVERIVDGLVVSLLVFGCCLSLRGTAGEKGWMMPMAYISLGVFLAATTFLAFALKWPQLSVRIAVTMTLLPQISPRIAAILEEKLHQMIRGFLVLKDGTNLFMFVFWSLLYWICNGLGMWVLARGMGLDISVIGAFATMGIIAVGITLPNSPGLVGQFHYLTTLGLSLYLPSDIAGSMGLAYAILLHGIQVVWYVGMGALSMLTSHVSFADLFRREPEAEPVAGTTEGAA
jgi:glycosyltransferase 2 family protein